MARIPASVLNITAGLASAAGALALVLAGMTVTVGAQSTAPSPSVRRTQPAGHARTAQKAKLRSKKQQAETILEAPPPPPPTPEQMPAVPPEVSYSDGLLTINAPNSTLSDVLAAVRRVTGATIEKPPGGGDDRVAVHLGPGQPKDVLSSLFNGSRYDYVILGPMNHPGGVQRIILTARSSVPARSPVMANTAARPMPNPRPPAVEPEPPDNSGENEEMAAPEQTVPEQEAPPEQPQPPPTMPEPPQQAQPQGQENPQQPRVKSPEELLRELQQMQQQQQNQQQNQQQSPQ